MERPHSLKALEAVAQVHAKLDSGHYAMEEVPCWCGMTPAQDTPLTRLDRYGFPHRMVLCENCLLIRANPRMTAAAYQEFYNTEYRTIYDGFEWGDTHAANDDFLFMQQSLRSGIHVKQLMDEMDLPYKTVVDFGCFLGGALQPFKESGATVYGVEQYAHGRTYAASRGIEVVERLEQLIDRGIQADLILCVDVIEHLFDFEVFRLMRKLLAKNGRLFVYTPGILAIDIGKAWQNAHTWQFSGVTLDMVMRRLGYLPDALDDRCVSLWTPVDKGVIPAIPLHWRDYIMEAIEGKEKRSLAPVWTMCKFNQTHMLKNLEANLAHKLPSFSALRDTRQGEVMLVSGGPSVDAQLPMIREMAARGVPLMVIERMYPWATKHGLKVEYVVSLDASEGVQEGFTAMQPDVTYLFLAATHPALFELVKDEKVYIWSGVSGTTPEAASVWQRNDYDRLLIVNTGGSVGLASINLAVMLGFRDLHLFGLDCMVPSPEQAYATGIAGESVPRSYMEVEVNGETVLTCTPFLAFAQQFFEIVEQARKAEMIHSLTVHGESLINKMWAADQSGISPILMKA